MDAPAEKRGRGRPRKGEVVVKPVKEKKPPGRPRLHTPEEAKELQRKANRENMARKYAEKKAAKEAAGVPDGRAKERVPLEIRLAKKIVKMDNGCWRWVGAVESRNGNNYGAIGIGMKEEKDIVSAHRAVFNFANPDDPLREGEALKKCCETELCVNPDHWRREMLKGHRSRNKLAKLLRNVQGSEG